jgi:hypothetical protein
MSPAPPRVAESIWRVCQILNSKHQASALIAAGQHLRLGREWTPTRLLREAAAIGPSTIALVGRVLATKPHPEHGFRACLGILSLVRGYGPERLEAAYYPESRDRETRLEVFLMDRALGPDEGFCVVIIAGDEAVDMGDEFGDAGK